MSTLLGGALRNYERTSVEWPAQAGPFTGLFDRNLGSSINVGVTNLEAQIEAARGRLTRDENGNVVGGEKVTIVGLSAGSLVVDEVLRDLAASPQAPGEDEVTFIVVADSSRQAIIKRPHYDFGLNYVYQPPLATRYDVITVNGEYDGLSDFPDRFNLLAIANAWAGSIFVHVPSLFEDFTKVPPENKTVDVNSLGGVTTHYLLPTEKLPLVQLFPFLASSEAALKAQVDKGYSRNDVVAAEAAAPVATARVASTVEGSAAPAAEVPAARAAKVVRQADAADTVSRSGSDAADKEEAATEAKSDVATSAADAVEAEDETDTSAAEVQAEEAEEETSAEVRAGEDTTSSEVNAPLKAQVASDTDVASASASDPSSSDSESSGSGDSTK